MRLRRCDRKIIALRARLPRCPRQACFGHPPARQLLCRAFTATPLAARGSSTCGSARALRCNASDDDAILSAWYGGAVPEQHAPEHVPTRTRFQHAPDEECARARSVLVKLLERRPYPAALLHRKLEDKKFSVDAIFWSVESVKEAGIQSDLEFAAEYARTKLLSEKWALRKIYAELRNKRISVADVNAALERVKRDELETRVPSNDEQGGAAGADGDRAREGMHRLLVAAAEKQLVQMPGKPLVTRQRHVAGYLGRRGHDYDTVLRVMTELGIGLDAEEDE